MPIWNSSRIPPVTICRSPCRQIAVYSQLLEKKHAKQLEGKAAQYLDYCIEGAQRMELLITRPLAYSQAGRTSDAPAESVSIREVIETVKKNLSTTIEETQADISPSELPGGSRRLRPLGSSLSESGVERIEIPE